MPSPVFAPVLLKGMTIHPEDPLQFDFIIDSGNTGFTTEQVEAESERLVKYFLASMTVPKDDLWVNLSPYESDRIIPEELGKTELGRDMLAQDYILKQLTASLMYPEKELGKKFWDRIYARAKDEFGTSEIPVNTFNKVWVLPESATVYEYEQTVYVVDARLKVMLDSDYEAMKYEDGRGKVEDGNSNLDLQSSIIKEIILPEIEHEVNHGEHFAPLRQIYHSLILAKWYKETVKNSLLTQVYADKNLTDGIDIDDPTVKDQIYARYMEAYKKGVFNYIKEDYDRLSDEVIPRKYFSGGLIIGAGEIYRTSSPVGDSVNPNYRATVKVTPQKNGASSPIFGDFFKRRNRDQQFRNPSDIFEALYNYDNDQVRAFLASGAEVDAINMEGMTPLQSAIREAADINGLGLFMTNKNLPEREKRRRTQLIKPIIKTLLAAGADVDKQQINLVERTENGFSSLHFAAIWGDSEILGLLLKKTKHVDRKDADGTTPLILASFNGRTDAVRMLLEHGANPNAESELGTPLFVARPQGHKAIVDLLILHGAKDTRGQSSSPILGGPWTPAGARKVLDRLHQNDPNKIRKAIKLLSVFSKQKEDIARLQRVFFLDDIGCKFDAAMALGFALKGQGMSRGLMMRASFMTSSEGMQVMQAREEHNEFMRSVYKTFWREMYLKETDNHPQYKDALEYAYGLIFGSIDSIPMSQDVFDDEYVAAKEAFDKEKGQSSSPVTEVYGKTLLEIAGVTEGAADPTMPGPYSRDARDVLLRIASEVVDIDQDDLKVLAASADISSVLNYFANRLIAGTVADRNTVAGSIEALPDNDYNRNFYVQDLEKIDAELVRLLQQNVIQAAAMLLEEKPVARNAVMQGHLKDMLERGRPLIDAANAQYIALNQQVADHVAFWKEMNAHNAASSPLSTTELRASSSPVLNIRSLEERYGKAVHQSQVNIAFFRNQVAFAHSPEASDVGTLIADPAQIRFVTQVLDNAQGNLSIYDRDSNTRVYQPGPDEGQTSDSKRIRSLFLPFDDAMRRSLEQHPGYHALTWLDFSNNFGNPEHISYSNGQIYYPTGYNLGKRFEQGFDDPFYSLVQYPDGKIDFAYVSYKITSVERVDGYYDKVMADAFVGENKLDPQSVIFSAVPIIADGEPFDLSQAIRKGIFQDLRQLYVLPPIKHSTNVRPGEYALDAVPEAIRAGVFFGLGQLAENDYEKAAEALTGPVRLKMAIPISGAGEFILDRAQIRKILATRNYEEETDRDRIEKKDPQEGKYVFASDTEIVIYLKPNPYPHQLIGRTHDGHIFIQAIGGSSGRVGVSVKELVEYGKKMNLRDLFTISQGTGVALGYNEHGLADVGDHRTIVGPSEGRQAGSATISILTPSGDNRVATSSPVSNKERAGAELLLVLDPLTGIPTGETVTREEAHAKGIWHGVDHYMVIKRATDEVIVQLRGEGTKSAGSKDISAGGHRGAVESPDGGREVELEQELKLRPGEYEVVEMDDVFRKMASPDEESEDGYLNEKGIFVYRSSQRNNEFSTLRIILTDVTAEEINRRIEADRASADASRKEVAKVEAMSMERIEKDLEPGKARGSYASSLKQYFDNKELVGKIRRLITLERMKRQASSPVRKGRPFTGDMWYSLDDDPASQPPPKGSTGFVGGGSTGSVGGYERPIVVPRRISRLNVTEAEEHLRSGEQPKIEIVIREYTESLSPDLAALLIEYGIEAAIEPINRKAEALNKKLETIPQKAVVDTIEHKGGGIGQSDFMPDYEEPVYGPNPVFTAMKEDIQQLAETAEAIKAKISGSASSPVLENEIERWGVGAIWQGRKWTIDNDAYQYPDEQEVFDHLDGVFAQVKGRKKIMADTAPAYNTVDREDRLSSEEWMGRYLRAHPENARKAIISTKVGEEGIMEGETKGRIVHSVDHLKFSVGRSLRQLERIDLLYLHQTSIEALENTEYMAAFRKMKQDGYGGIRYLGASISGAEMLREALAKDLLDGFDVVQTRGSVFLENPDLMDQLTEKGIRIVLNSVGRFPGDEGYQEAYRRVARDRRVTAILLGSRDLDHIIENIGYIQSSSPVFGETRRIVSRSYDDNYDDLILSKQYKLIVEITGKSYEVDGTDAERTRYSSKKTMIVSGRELVQGISFEINPLQDESVWIKSVTPVDEGRTSGVDGGRRTSSPVTSEDQVGGIDLNGIDVVRTGGGVEIQFDPIEVQQILDMGITGFAPVIINIVPLPSVLPLLGLAPQREEEEYELSKVD